MAKNRGALPPQLLSWFFNRCPKRRRVDEAKKGLTRWAVESGDLHVLQEYYEPKSSPEYTCVLSGNDFLRACTFGHVDIVSYFLTTGHTCTLTRHECVARPDVCRLACGFSAAVEGQRLITVKLLLDYGADVNREFEGDNMTKFTPLLTAVRKMNVDMVVLLLAYGAVVPKKSMFRTIRQGGPMERLVEQAWRQQHGQEKKDSKRKMKRKSCTALAKCSTAASKIVHQFESDWGCHFTSTSMTTTKDVECHTIVLLHGNMS
jgi:ankyrin repeat protein